MADIRTSSLGGVPKGETADRPASPSIGDVFYNGTLGCLEIYTAQGWVANSAPPGIPTIGTATYSGTNKEYNNSSASITFTPGEGGGLPNSYRATSNPGGFTGTSSSSPITVTGLQSATAYTFSVTGTNNFGTSAGSINSNSITANTVPAAPIIGILSYASSTSLSLTFTPSANGGSTITNYKYSLDGINYTLFSPAQTSSPLLITGLTPNTSYTAYIKAVNLNGDSVASAASNSSGTGAVVTGGTLTSDSTYYYRTFTGTGNLIVSNNTLTADVLVVAGGGGGGGNTGAGGGAGGLLTFVNQAISPATHLVSVGGGGAGGKATNISDGSRATNGVDSQFSSLTLVKGGGGGGSYSSNNAIGQGASGGSGGGGGVSESPVINPGGSATPSGQGNAGGSGYYGPGYAGGSGGGAGSAAINSVSGTTGNPGVGATSSLINAMGAATSTGHLSGGNYYYAGGGAGGHWNVTQKIGGLGGGGNGAFGSEGFGLATGGTANTGGGAGGGDRTNPSPAGGSGIVIVRYTKSQVGG